MFGLPLPGIDAVQKVATEGICSGRSIPRVLAEALQYNRLEVGGDPSIMLRGCHGLLRLMTLE